MSHSSLPAHEPEKLAERYRRGLTLRVMVWAGLVASLACGCGRSVRLGQVEGTVQLDGQPIDKVMVVFIPEDRHLPQSFGITDERGHFQLRCNNKKLGAAVGNHRVMIVDAASGSTVKSRDDDPPEQAEIAVSRIPAIYNRADKTPLRATVSAGSQIIPPFEIQSGKKPA